MRGLELITYVITPFHYLFLRFLCEKGLQRNDQAIRFINNPIKLMGCRIKKEDAIEYYGTNHFQPECLDEIEKQILMRKENK